MNDSVTRYPADQARESKRKAGPGAAGEGAAEQTRADGPGALLRAARERGDWPLDEVADALRLLPRVIADLEADDWSRLPSPTFARGYYRAAAKLLGIDVEAILAAYDRVSLAEREPSNARGKGAATPRELIRRYPGASVSVVAAGIFAAIVGMIILLWPGGSGDPSVASADTDTAAAAAPYSPAPNVRQVPTVPTVPTEDSALSVPPLPESVSASPLRSVAPPVPSGMQVSTRATLPVETAASVTGAETAAEPVPGGETPADTDVAPPVAGAGSRRITESGQDRLVFHFSDDCWVDVKDMDGRALYSDLSRAGDSLQLVGQGPFRVLLGYAPAVEMSFNGEAVGVRAQTRNNVATLTLGR